MKLPQSFFNRPCPEVARDLIGVTLHFGSYSGIITETEAYRGLDDPASHAFCGPTKRNAVMYGLPGFSYVYLIYGMYYCLNISTEEERQPAAVLIRGLSLTNPYPKALNGPGKLCRELQITKDHNGLRVFGEGLFSLQERVKPVTIQETPRIGISKGKEKMWRFVMQNT